MNHEQAAGYIRAQRSRGVHDDAIRDALRQSGWPEDTIAAAFTAADTTPGFQPISPTGAPVLPEFGAILREAWNMFTENLWTLLGIYVLPFVITAIICGAIAIGAIFATGFNPFGDGSPTSTTTFATVTAVFLSMLALFTVMSWAYIALIHTIQTIDTSDARPGIWESLKTVSGAEIVSYWWVAFLYGSIVIGGFFLFLIPGFLYAIWLSVAVFIFVIEKEKGMRAIIKSREYVRGYWGAVFLRLFIFQLIIVLISSGIEIVAGFGGGTGGEAVRVIGTTLRYAFSLATVPLAALFTYIIYKNLAQIHAGRPFEPTQKQKVGFSLAAIYGFVIVPVMGLVLFLGIQHLIHQNVLQQQQESAIQQQLIQQAIEREQQQNALPIGTSTPSFKASSTPRAVPMVPAHPLTPGAAPQV